MPVTIDGTTGISGPASGLTDLNASNLSTGTVPNARFPATLPAASGANLTALNASNLGSGTVPDARFPATLPAASGANLTNLNASNLSTGTVGTARLGTGTADSTTYLRGDGTWASAGASTTYGAVGTYTIGLVSVAANTVVAEGSTVAGSSLLRTNDYANNTGPLTFLNSMSNSPGLPEYNGTPSSLGLSGTWRTVTRSKNASTNSQWLPMLVVRVS